MKLINPALAWDRDFRDRFLVEARLAASLDHPNVIPVHDAGEIDGQLYLAMRFVEGSDLRELLAEGRLGSERALGVCGQVAAALDAAHRKGLVHRDVKPSNVLLDEEGHAYLADFGLTRRLVDQAPGFEAGLSLGTPSYVAPEQIRGESVGGRADQYALACVLYECLSGEQPYGQLTELATLYAHLEHEPPEYPGLEAVFARALAKKPDERYESCAAFIAAARTALLGPRRRRRLAAAIAAVVLLAAATVAAVLISTGGNDPVVGDDWTRVPHVESVFGGGEGTYPFAVASDESRVVAIGVTATGPGQEDSRMAAWSSSDGVTWTRSSPAEQSFQQGFGVAASPWGFIVVGSEEPPDRKDCPPCDVTHAAVWRSNDGTSWQRVPRDEEIFGGPGEGFAAMQDVVVAGPGLVAVGNAPDRDSGLVRPMAWTSPDGETWSRVVAETLPLDSPWPALKDRLAWPWRVAVANDGPLVAVGTEVGVSGKPAQLAAVWVSPNGKSWARVTHDETVFGDGSVNFELTDVTAGGPGFVAVGGEGGEEWYTWILKNGGPKNLGALIVTSVDGRSWSRVPAAQLPGGGEKVYLDGVTTGGPGLIASGWRRNNPGIADADLDPVVWTSSDGLAWTEAADPNGAFSQPGGQIIWEVTAGGPGLVAVGIDGDTKTFNTAIWTSP